MNHLLQPFYQVWEAPPHQWHPVWIHFPIVFLVVEAVLVFYMVLKRDLTHERLALRLLYWSVWSLIAAAILGIHDSGLHLGDGNKFRLGLEDRWNNAMRFQSSVTVHFWLASGVLAITGVRLSLRRWWRSAALTGFRGYIYAALTLLGLWILAAAGYVGGLISHQ